MKFARYKRELSTLLAYFALLVVVGVVAPAFFGGSNLRDLALNNAPILLVATGMTLVILVGEIDISVGSQFAVCTVVAGLLAKTGIALPLLLAGVVYNGCSDGRIEWCAYRLAATSFDHRHSRDAGRVARCVAMDDCRRMGAGSACQFPVVWARTTVWAVADRSDCPCAARGY